MSGSDGVRVLLTGFEPFMRWTVNPSALVVAALAKDPPKGVDLRTTILPVVFETAGPLLVREIEACRPKIVLMLGLGGGPALRVERVAVNLNDIPGRHDNAGRTPEEEPIDPDGPDAYLATIAVRKVVRRLREADVPAAESLSAGTFLCNHVLYAARHHAARTGAAYWAGFIHLPALPQQADGGPSLDLATQVRGVRLALEVLAAERKQGADGAART